MVSHDLDDETLRRLARSFYVVKMARYAGLLVALLAIGALATARSAPTWVPVVLGGLAVAFVAAMVVTRARYVSAQRRPRPPTPPGAPSSR
ncbi:hypothetical protein G5V58_00795 [Nocardioides anomalus]|uniref:Uncharacterized protein n=1 Tax=Nocardioides anomalus TaxID=2712223 RepID=A0A6G6W8G5_9ACTN|nr:hypothetical protein [Nocardioides anomalus]QIG41499.1 hypothetical protein G5V58_00795 [Nocardioides anomalus]